MVSWWLLSLSIAFVNEFAKTWVIMVQAKIIIIFTTKKLHKLGPLPLLRHTDTPKHHSIKIHCWWYFQSIPKSICIVRFWVSESSSSSPPPPPPASPPPSASASSSSWSWSWSWSSSSHFGYTYGSYRIYCIHLWTLQLLFLHHHFSATKAPRESTLQCLLVASTAHSDPHCTPRPRTPDVERDMTGIWKPTRPKSTRLSEKVNYGQNYTGNPGNPIVLFCIFDGFWQFLMV